MDTQCQKERYSLTLVTGPSSKQAIGMVGLDGSGRLSGEFPQGILVYFDALYVFCRRKAQEPLTKDPMCNIFQGNFQGKN